MREKKRQKKNSRKRKEQPRSSIWGTIFWVLAIWYVVSLFAGGQKPGREDISYTAFKRYVRQGHVKEVTFIDSRIEGRFKSSFRLPEDADQDDVGQKGRKTRTPEESSAEQAKENGDADPSAPVDQDSVQRFATVKPDVEDPQLLDLLEQNNVTVNAEVKQQNWWAYALINFLPWILLIGYFVYAGRMMRRRMQAPGAGKGGEPGGGLFGIGRSKAKKFRREKGGTTFDDVAGLEQAKSDVREIVDYLKDPRRFTRLGADVPRGILLMGPPGCGKTLLAKATAGEADIPFFSISGSEFIEMFVGVGASRVRNMFTQAKKEAPAIIFIDEIESIGRRRGAGLGGGHDEREQTLNQILSEMDGFEPHESVVVMAATNRPDVLDPALTRPGRFDRQITLELPRKDARRDILKIHSREVPLADDVDLNNIAARTVGFSGADLKNLVNEAALLAGREDQDKVTGKDFDNARDKILLGAEREEILTDEERRLVAYHESGHALTAKLLPHADPLQKVTIIPRGKSLGATEQVPEIDRHNLSRSYLMDVLAVRLGGRTAEKMVFNDITNGAASDLKGVKQIARKMVCQWGMSDKLGPLTFRLGEENVFLGQEIAQQKDYSEETARQIDEEIHRIVEQAEQNCLETLVKHRKDLDRIAEVLLEEETLNKEDIDRLLDSEKQNGKEE
ncbi:MAG: ATP-dependent zinc metalloprotease FtsH [Candidatus Omnitrophota bacterium]